MELYVGVVRPRHVILDRDGVLNVELSTGWLASISEWKWEHGALEGLSLLAHHDVPVSIATNQSGIGRGLVSADDVDDVHAWLTTQLTDLGVRLVGIFVCPHAPEELCACRKPKPGLVTQALEAAGVDAAFSVLIGDAGRDLVAAHEARVEALLVRTGKGATVEPGPDVRSYADLAQAVATIFG